MTTALWGHVAIYSLLICLALSTLVFWSFFVNMRMWLHDYPPEVRAAVPPLSAEEKRQQKVMAILLIVLALGTLLASAIHLRIANGDKVAFATVFISTYLIFSAFNLFDLLLIDGLGVLIKPKLMILPGSEHLAQPYYGFGYHVKSFIKGSVMGVGIALAVSLVALL
ncbi:MAG: hypothetical protein IT324_08290 [Anaerolineae bacterium]|nr:hypothetical protein [Anaerolineae bacterium]